MALNTILGISGAHEREELNLITTKKNQYYLRIFTHGSESVGKFSITYGYYLRTTLPTDITYRF